jgi:hypothetical protein
VFSGDEGCKFRFLFFLEYFPQITARNTKVTAKDAKVAAEDAEFTAEDTKNIIL